MTSIDFRVVGEFALLVNGVPAQLGPPRRSALLAVLIASANETVLAPTLIGELWPEHPPANALANLRTYASELRRQLPTALAARITTRHGGYQVRIEPVELDLWRQREQCAIARSALDRGDCEAAIAMLEPLTPALAGSSVFPGVTAGPAIEATRAGFEEECRIALEAYFEARVLADTSADILGALRAHVRRHPLGERGHALLMTALSQAGQNAAALETYQHARQLLVDELGIEPGIELQGLQQSILRGDPLPGTRRRGPGHHAEPFRPFQLPPDLPDFSGRREAVKSVVALLSGGPAGAWPSVASITGMPGTGKSALAVHVGHQLREEFADGQLYLDLAGDDLGAVDPHDALGQMLTGLGIAPEAVPVTSAERTAMLRSLCCGRRLLFVLDNARSTEHIAPLVPADARCGLLVTSRSQLTGLQSWPQVELMPLDAAEGIELLARIVGAQRVREEPEAASRVVDLCAGLPLAIRIAGTRLVSRYHQSIGWLAGRLAGEHTRLDELAVTGVALRGSFDLAYRSLEPAQQRGLRVLSVLDCQDFGAPMAAAALATSLGCQTPAVRTADGRPRSALREAEDLIDGLVQARLLSVTAGRGLDVPRFRFHQLVRLYAREVAHSADAPEVIDAAVAAAYGAGLVAAAQMDQRLRRHLPLITSTRAQLDPELLPGPADPAAWFVTEHAALVGAVHDAAARGWHDLTWDLALTLQRFLETHHHFRDWQEVAAAGLHAARASGCRPAEAASLCSLGELRLVQDEHHQAAEHFGAALRLVSEADAAPGEVRSRARALLGLCTVHAARGQLDESAASARKAIDVVDEDADPGIAAEAWMGLGATLHLQGELAAASASFERALAGFVATGDLMNQAILLVNMGTTAGVANQLTEAERWLRQSAQICQQIGFRNGEGFAFTALGTMLLRSGDRPGGERALLDALAIVRDYADTFTECVILTKLGELYQSSDLDKAREHYAGAAALLAAGQLPVLLADALAGLGKTEALAGRPDAARVAWTKAASILDPIDAGRAAHLRAKLASLASP